MSSFADHISPMVKHDTEATIAFLCSEDRTNRLYAKAMINMALRADVWVAIEVTFLNAPMYLVVGMRPMDTWEHDRYGGGYRTSHDYGTGAMKVRLVSGELPLLKRYQNANGSESIRMWKHCTLPWQTSDKQEAIKRVKYLEELKAFSVLHPEFDHQNRRR